LRLLDGANVFSATDLSNYLACEHLTRLDLSALRGNLARPNASPAQADLLAALGNEHERRYVERIREVEAGVVNIDRSSHVATAAAETERAMSAGASVIYQATFFDGTWLARADFLRRVDGPFVGGRWAWHYEVEDTKLARHNDPRFLLQLCHYSEHVTRVQGVTPSAMYLVLGDGTRHAYRVEDFMAYYRSVKARFLKSAGTEMETYPLPVDHCALCPWEESCTRRWHEDDHLSLVAGITRLQIARLNDAHTASLTALAAAPDDARPPDMAIGTYQKLQRQARLQDEQRRAVAAHNPNWQRFELLHSAVEERNGFFLLPAPSTGDVFFDMEGDPYYDIGTGLEYLFGAYTAGGDWQSFWGCDRAPIPGSESLGRKTCVRTVYRFRYESLGRISGHARVSLCSVRKDGAKETRPTSWNA